MVIKFRLRTRSLSDMRTFLSDANVDMGCTPTPVNTGDGYIITVLADQQDYQRLVEDHPEHVTIDAAEQLDTAAALQWTSAGNRFHGNRIPHGLGTKE